MRKQNLFLASALLSVMLISGVAGAATTVSTTATATTKAAPTAVMEPGKGPHHMMMKKGMPQLSEEGQKIMRESMEAARESNKAVYDQIKAKHEELNTLLKAPTFDKAAYLAKEAELQTLHAKTREAHHEAFAAAAAKLSVEDRTKLADKGGRHQGMGMMKGSMKCPMMDDMGPQGTEATPDQE